MPILRQPVLRLVAVTVAMALAGAGGVAYANHQFSDVPNAGFHDEIGAIVDAGCATGFSGGTFQPRSGATRGQFAFWLNNCGGRIAASTNSAIEFIDGGDVAGIAVDSVPLSVGGTGTQIVHLHANVVGFITDTRSAICVGSAGCGVRLFWEADGSRINPTEAIFRVNHDRDSETVSTDAVVTAIGGVTHTYTLRAEGFGLVDNPVGQRLGLGDAQLVATVYPFGGEGNGGVIGPASKAPEAQPGVIGPTG